MKIDQTILVWLLLLLLSIFSGIGLRTLMHKYVSRLSQKTSWKIDDILIEEIGKKIVYWLPFAFIYFTFPIYFDTIIGDEKLFIYLRKIILSLFILTISDFTIRLFYNLSIFSSEEINTSSSILRNILKISIYVLAVLVIFQNFGVEIYPIIATLGIGGLAVALALQSTLSNLFSGLQIIASKKIQIGHFIELDNGKKGIVKDITWRNTVLNTWQNNTIIIPNSKIIDSVVENYFLEDKEILFSIPLGVSYNSDLAKVEKTILEVANHLQQVTPEASKDFLPFVRFQRFGDSSIDLSVFLKANEFGGQFVMTSAFIYAIHKKFAEVNIEIPYPIRTIYLNNGAQ